MTPEKITVLGDPQLSSSLKKFLLSNTNRGVNSITDQLNEELPPLEIVAVREEDQQLEEILDELVKTKHKLKLIPRDKIPAHARSNHVDALLLTESQTAMYPEISNSCPTFLLGSTIDQDTPVLATDYTRLVKALARSKDVAPLHVIHESLEESNNLALLLDETDTYFNTHPHSLDKFLENIDQLDRDRGIAVYFDHDETGDESVMRLLMGARDHLPIIYAKTSPFWRDHNLERLMDLGLFDFANLNIKRHFPDLKGDCEEKRCKAKEEAVIKMEALTNKLHAAFISRDIYDRDMKRAKEYARASMPHIFLHAPRRRAQEYVKTLSYNATNILTAHINKEHQAIYTPEALEEALRITEGWQPNIIYIESQSRANTDEKDIPIMKALSRIRKEHKDAVFVFGYDSRNDSDNLYAELIESHFEKSDNQEIHLVRQPVGPVIETIIDEAWKSHIRIGEDTKARMEYETRQETLRDYRDILSVDAGDLELMLSSRFDFDEEPEPVYLAQPIYPGAATGRIYNDLSKAIKDKNKGKAVILYVEDISDLTLTQTKQMHGLDGIIFSKVSHEDHHTIDLQRSGIPMIKADDFSITEGGFFKSEEYTLDDFVMKPGDVISFDGGNGKIYDGEQPLAPAMIREETLNSGSPDFEVERYKDIMAKVNEVLSYADVEVMFDADTVEEISAGRVWGVESVGLVRTENLLKASPELMESYGELLMACISDEKIKQDRAKADRGEDTEFYRHAEEIVRQLKIESSARFEKLQEQELYKLLDKQGQRRIHVRLLDPPMNEFFSAEDVEKISDNLNGPYDSAKDSFIDLLKDTSVRGARLLRWEEIYESQIKALFSAYNKIMEDGKPRPDLRIFTPYVSRTDQLDTVVGMMEKINRRYHNGLHTQLIIDHGVTLETPGGGLSSPEMMEKLGTRNFAVGTNDLFPLVEGSERSEMSYDSYAEDGTPLLCDSIHTYMEQMLRVAEEGSENTGIEYNIGLCGELNNVKLHQRNLGRYVTRFDYVSASRPKQIPLLKLLVAQHILKSYGID